MLLHPWPSASPLISEFQNEVTFSMLVQLYRVQLYRVQKFYSSNFFVPGTIVPGTKILLE
jgi:hypothetical protein